MLLENPVPEETEKEVMVEVPDGDDIQNWFTYHSPTEQTIPRFKSIREAGLALARTIMINCPESADRSAAIRKVREAVMTANASIACCGK